MACEKFKELERQIRKECEAVNLSEKITKYLINRASNAIRRSSHDVYGVAVSIGEPTVIEHTNYTSLKEINFFGGVMYLNMVVL